MAQLVNQTYGVAVSNGTTALEAAVLALNLEKGSEVILPDFTIISCVLAIVKAGLVPVPVDCTIDTWNIDIAQVEEKINKKTKAIMVVHLYGQVAQMDKIVKLCTKYSIHLIEDCAQAHGACFGNRVVGSFGEVGCFSFYPSKNLGGFGEGGAIITNNQQIAKMIKVLRNYGSEKKYYNKIIGTNSRLDELQAGLLRVRLAHLEELTQEKEKLAEKYMKTIKNHEIVLPKERNNTRSIWHQYVIRTRHRDAFLKYLEENGVETAIHYPIPPHLSEAYRYLGYKKGSFPITERYAEEILSLPIYTGMTQKEQDWVIEVINKF